MFWNSRCTCWAEKLNWDVYITPNYTTWIISVYLKNVFRTYRILTLNHLVYIGFFLCESKPMRRRGLCSLFLWIVGAWPKIARNPTIGLVTWPPWLCLLELSYHPRACPLNLHLNACNTFEIVGAISFRHVVHVHKENLRVLRVRFWTWSCAYLHLLKNQNVVIYNIFIPFSSFKRICSTQKYIILELYQLK